MQVGRQSRQGGPSLALTAWICIGLLFGGLALGVALGGMMPLPYGPVAAVQRYVRAQPVAVQVMAVAVFGSSVPLAIYAATVNARLWQLGATAPGATIALAGGILAAGTLGLTGLVGWTLSRPEISGDTALVRALYFLVFLVGGPGHIVALGLLVAGMAAPSLILGLLPRLLAWVGLAIAALSELTTLVLVWPELGVILPVARVLALAWLLMAGVRLRRGAAVSGMPVDDLAVLGWRGATGVGSDRCPGHHHLMAVSHPDVAGQQISRPDQIYDSVRSAETRPHQPAGPYRRAWRQPALP
jgi:hypothetical protein